MVEISFGKNKALTVSMKALNAWQMAKKAFDVVLRVKKRAFTQLIQPHVVNNFHLYPLFRHWIIFKNLNIVYDGQKLLRAYICHIRL